MFDQMGTSKMEVLNLNKFNYFLREILNHNKYNKLMNCLRKKH